MEDIIPETDSTTSEEEILVIQQWAQTKLRRQVFRQYRINPRNRPPQQPPQNQPPQDPLGPQKQQITNSVQHLTQGATPKSSQYVRELQGMNRRMQDGATTALQGRATSLVKEEKDLKDSSRFTEMMKLLKEYEAAAQQPGANAVNLRVQREALRKAALTVKNHYETEYKSEIEKKPDGARGRGHAAAKRVYDDIIAAENDRAGGIQKINALIDDFKQQITTRQQGGAPVDLSSMAVLENLRKLPGLPTEIDTQLSTAISQARKLEGDTILTSLDNQPDTLRKEVFDAKATLCMELGTCKAPQGTESGASDSFFLKDHTGKAAFVFKPLEGEKDQSGRGWEKGGAAPRELLASALNDQFKAMGLDCGLSKTALVTLDNPLLKEGKTSKAQKRTGALQEFAPNNGSLYKLLGKSDTETPEDELDQFCTDPQELEARKKKIDKGDLQKIALFDFVTLNLDRSPSNMLIRKEGNPPDDKIRLVPIDGGNLLPCREALEQGIDGLGRELTELDAPLGGGNGLMQLPQAQEDFSVELQQKIDAMDPDALSNGLKTVCAQNEQEAPALQGGVKPEVFDTMKLSIMFLKRACGTQANPRLTPADMSDMYQQELTGFLTRMQGPTKPQPNDQPFVPPAQQQIEQEMDRLIGEQVLRRQAEQARALVLVEIEKLGGQKALVDLGWLATLAASAPDQALDVLRKKTPEPVALKKYQDFGGDDTLKEFEPGANLDEPIKKKTIKLEQHLMERAYMQEGGDQLMKTLGDRFAVIHAEAKEKYLAALRLWDQERLKVTKGTERDQWTKAKGNEKPEIELPIFPSENFKAEQLLNNDANVKLADLKKLKDYFKV